LRLNSKIRKISGLFMIMLVVGMILVTPAMACPAGTPCDFTASGIEKNEITGMEKYENIAFALNLKDVQKLSGSPSATDLKQIEDGAKVYSLEKTLEDGSVDYVTGVILPVEVIAEDNISVQISNVFVIWSDEKPAQVMSSTQIFEDKTLKELTLSRVSDDGEILNTQIVSKGAIIGDANADFFTTSTKDGYWTCVGNEIIDDCLCSVLGIVCPPGTPSICDVCLTLLTPCYYMPSILTCSPAALCMGLEIAVVMAQCY